jgi:hypothetical protein
MLLCFSVTYSQSDENRQVETMTVFGSFTPTIKLTPKITHNPDADSYTIKPPVIDFEMKTEAIHSVENTELIESEQLPKEKLVKYPHNYLILGFGNYTTPYGEFYANTSAITNHAFGVHLKHLSSQGGIKNYADNAYSYNLGDLYYKFSNKSFTMKADAFLQRDVVHYYGFHPDEAFNPASDSIKQRYFLGGVVLSLTSNDIDPADFNYRLKMNYNNFSDRHRNSENVIDLNAHLKKGVYLFNTKIPQIVGATINFSYFGNNIAAPSSEKPDFSFNDILLGFNPYFECEWNEYRLKVGVDGGVTRSDNDTWFYLHPIFEASIKVIAKRLYLFACIDGAVERNSFRSLTEINPFIAPGAYIPNFSNKKIGASGGFSAMIAKGWDMKIGGKYTRIEKMPFFLSIPDAPIHNFSVVYDNIHLSDLFFESSYSISNKLSLFAGFHYFVQLTDSLEYAYYHPDFKITISGKYRPFNRLLLGVEWCIMSKVWVFNPYINQSASSSFNNVQLPYYCNLNLNAEFRVWNELWLFLQANNLFAQHYERFLYYPTQGLNILGGVRFRF